MLCCPDNLLVIYSFTGLLLVTCTHLQKWKQMLNVCFFLIARYTNWYSAAVGVLYNGCNSTLKLYL